MPASDLPNVYPYLPDISGLESASAAANAAALPGALLADLSTYATAELSALFGSSTAAESASLFGTDLLPSLTAFFANPFDLLSF